MRERGAVLGVAPTAPAAPAARALAAAVVTAVVAAVAVAVAAAVAAALVGAAPASADEVSGDQFAALVERAAHDPAALGELRRVTRVDGRPADIGRALEGVSGEELRSRLGALAAGAGARGAPEVAPPGDPRRTARQILEGRKFNPAPAPRPFRGVLRRLGAWLRPVVEPLNAAWERITSNALAMGALAVAAVAVAAAGALLMIRRRTSAGVERGGRRRRAGGGDDPDDLERRAAAAEQAGDLDLALRLRFRAGVLRLDRAGVIADRPALTAGELTRRLTVAPLRELADAFEEVAYGGRAATPGDLDAARSGWARVLETAAR